MVGCAGGLVGAILKPIDSSSLSFVLSPRILSSLSNRSVSSLAKQVLLVFPADSKKRTYVAADSPCDPNIVGARS